MVRSKTQYQRMAFFVCFHHRFIISINYEAFCHPDLSLKAIGDHLVASFVSSPILSLSYINLYLALDLDCFILA